MWRFLQRDPVIRATVLVTVVVAVLSTPYSQAWPQALAYAQIAFLSLVVWGAFHRLSEFELPRELLFWRALGAAAGVWLLRVLVELVSEQGFVGGIVADTLGALVFLILLVVATVRPEAVISLEEMPSQRRIELLAGMVFTAGLFCYFVLLPEFWLDMPVTAHGVVTLQFYLVFCLGLALRFAYLSGRSTQRRWRLIYTILALALLLAALATQQAQRSPDDPLLLRVIFLASPLVAQVFATRVRHFAFPASRIRVEPWLPLRTSALRFTGVLLLYTLSMPVLHLLRQAMGLVAPELLTPSAVLLLVLVVVLGSLTLLQYQLLENRRRALQEHREVTEGRLRLLSKAFETMRLGITIKDLSGRILYLNPAEARMHGYTVDELVGRQSGVLGPEELIKPMAPDEARTMRCWSRDSVNTRRDGSTFPVHLTSDLVEDASGEAMAIVTTCEDITDRWRMEDALRQSERDYRGLFENAHDAIIIFRPEDERVLEVNSSACKLYGYSREEMLNLSMENMSYDISHGKRQLEEVLWKGDFHEFESRQYRRDRTLMYLEIRAAIVEYSGQLAILSINRDITDRKIAEENLRKANEELKTFMSLVSHDLRAPLVNLKGFSSELAETLASVQEPVAQVLEHMDPKQRYRVTEALQVDAPEAVDFIDKAVSRMDYYISALLKLSRAGRRELELEPLDMEVLVKDTLSTLVYQIDRSDSKVIVHSLPEVVADRVAMQQIMGNLLSNAVQYLDAERAGRIEIAGNRASHETTFSVQDNGRGISDEDLKKVFEPFRRAGRQTVAGEGMGLAYVQALVRRQGGRLWCDSTLGQGSCFYFTISSRLSEEEEHVEHLPTV